MKRFILLLFIVILFCPCLVQAKELTLGDLRVSYEEALSKKKEYDSLTNSAKEKIENKENALKEAEDTIANIDNQILNLEESIRESNEKIISLKEEAKNILQYLQILQGQNAYLEYVANSSSVSDLLRRMEAVSQIAFFVEDTLLSLEEEVENNKLLIEELKLEQKNLQDDVVIYQNIIVSEYGNLDDYNKYALNVNKEYEAAKSQYEAYQNLCLLNTGRIDDGVLIEECNQTPINGGWLKPLSSGYITSAVGYRYGIFHDGIDIGGNLEGTPIYAAATGVVKAIIPRTSCGGNRVYINVVVGGVQYTTYYYHLLEFGDIKVGDIVTQDTIIGYVGGGRSTSSLYGGYDSCTSGTHLHFGVQKGWSSSINIDPDQVIVPPGFLNQVDYAFKKRSDYYTG